MPVEKKMLGRLSDGQIVSRYILRNGNGTEASFTDLGAIWLTMLVHDREGRLRDVVLGCDDPELLLKNPGHMGEPVGRCANRIGGAQFTLNGRDFRLEANNGRNNLHSGNDYYRTRVWEAELSEAGLGSYVMFSLDSPDGDQGFPGNAKICVTYMLAEDDTLSIRYEAEADQDTLFNFTNHAYFNMNGHDSGDVLGQYVRLHADAWTWSDKESIPTGEIRKVYGTPMDFRTPKKLGQDIGADFDELLYGNGYDHNFCLNAFDGSIRPAAEMYAEESGIRMEVETDLEGLQLYTANGLKGDFAAKGGVHYGPRHGCCFETQHYPDAIHHPEFPSPVVRAGETFRTSTIFRFTTE